MRLASLQTFDEIWHDESFLLMDLMFMEIEFSSGLMTRQSTRLWVAGPRARVISQNGAIVTVETDKAVLRVNQSKVRRDYDPWHDVPLPRNLDKPEKEVPLEPDDGDEQLEEPGPQGDDVADYVADFQVFMTKVRSGTFSALNVSFENSSQILELSAPSCSITPLLIDYGLEASNPFDINMVSNVNKLAGRLRSMRPTIVLYNLLGVDKKNMRTVLYNISSELQEYIKDTGFILVVLDSMTSPVMTRGKRTSSRNSRMSRSISSMLVGIRITIVA